MSRGLGSAQRAILRILADAQLNLDNVMPDYREDFFPLLPDNGYDLDTVSSEGSSMRRAARGLEASGLVDLVVGPARVDYRYGRYSQSTTRYVLHARLPLVRWDDEVAGLAGTDVEEHCRGIAHHIGELVDSVRALTRLYGIDRSSEDLQLRSEAVAAHVQVRRSVTRTVDYHLRQLNRLRYNEPVGVAHLYTRHLAHWPTTEATEESETSNPVSL